MMDRDSLLDTIQRLLALGRSPNEHEARAALAKAHELLTRHNLSMAEVEVARTQKTAGDWTRQTYAEVASVDTLLCGALAIAHNHYFVRAVTERWFDDTGKRVGRIRITLFGRADNVDVAGYVVDFLVRTARALWRAHRRHTGSRSAATFYAGFCAGVRSQLLAAQRAAPLGEGHALAIIESEIDQAARSHYSHLQNARRRTVRGDENDFLAGVQAGKRTPIRDAVKSPDRPLLAMEGRL